MVKPTALLLIAIGALAMVIGAPGVYLAIYAYSDLGALGNGSFLLTVGGIAIAATVGVLAAYSADPARARFPAWSLSLVILAGSVLAVGYDTVNRMQFEHSITDAQKAQDALRQDNTALIAENARVKKAAQTTYAEARALDRSSSSALATIQREAAAAGLIHQKTADLSAQASALQLSAAAALRDLMQTAKSNRNLRCGPHVRSPKH